MTGALTSAGRLNVVEYAGDERGLEVPPILLLHGIGGSARSSAPLAEHLTAAGLTCWCIDAPGYGESADPRPGLDAADEVAELLEQRWPGRSTILIGTSWGGVIAATIALRHPPLVSALVLADSTRGSGTSEAKAAAMRGRITELSERGAAAVADERAGRLAAPGADPTVVESVRSSMAALRLPGFQAAAEFMAATDHGPRYAEIDRPALVLVGDQDVITGVAESRLIAERIAGAELHIIADAGHVAVQERPEVAAALIIDFVGRTT